MSFLQTDMRSRSTVTCTEQVAREPREGTAVQREDQQSVYSSHFLRATTATFLIDAREPIESVRVLLGHKYIITTQI
jgi:site-specific recombinase XerD